MENRGGAGAAQMVHRQDCHGVMRTRAPLFTLARSGAADVCMYACMYGAGRCCVRSRWGTAQEDEPAAHACRQPLVLAAVESEQGCISLAAPFCSTKAVQQAAQAAAILQTSRTRGRAHSLTNRACLRQIMPEPTSCPDICRSAPALVPRTGQAPA
jgi:hypothetical protein